MIKVQVEIPDTPEAKLELNKRVERIVRAHNAAEMAKGNHPNITVIEEPKPEPEKDDGTFEAVITKDLTDKDIKKLIKENSLKIDTRKNPSFLRKEIESLPDAADLVVKYKEAEVA